MRVSSTLLIVAVSGTTVWAEDMIPQTASPALGNFAWPSHGGYYGGLFGFGEDNYGGAPAPTQAPSIAELRKRQDNYLGPSCGIFATNTSWTYSCFADDYCGFNPGLARFGCCTASLGPDSLTGCFLPTTCVDSSAFTDTCTESGCGWDTLYCTSSDYPYCGRIVKGTFTASDCFTEPRASYALLATDADTEPSMTSSSSSLSRSSSSSSRSSNSASAPGESPSRIPFTQTQQTVGTSSSGGAAGIPTSTVTSTAVAGRLGKSSEQFYGFWMSLLMFIL